MPRFTAKTRRRSVWAFTLVELLVVVAIIVVLISLLLPSLANAKEQSRTAKCASNMRQIGVAISSFAAANNGRGPGGGANTFWRDATHTGTAGGSVAWQNILNYEVFGFDALPRLGAGTTNKLRCPSYVTWAGTGTGRMFAINPIATNDSLVVPPHALPPGATPYSAIVAPNYYLGSKLSVVGSPTQFLVLESERSGDGVNAFGGVVITLGDWVKEPPWSGPLGSGGSVAFRHRRGNVAAGSNPFARNVGNFLFFDGRVEAIRATDKIP